jgi:hypothetical protein
MRFARRLSLLAFALLVTPHTVGAHHSTAADYDESKSVAVSGTVSKVEWTNPHARFVLDVVGADKSVTSWSFELASPNSLTRAGWGRHTLNIGDALKVTGAPARSGKPLAVTKSVTDANGKKLFTGTMGILEQ